MEGESLNMHMGTDRGGGRSQKVLRPWRARTRKPMWGWGTTSKSRPAKAGVTDRAPLPVHMQNVGTEIKERIYRTR
jgi:hypothetical protein